MKKNKLIIHDMATSEFNREFGTIFANDIVLSPDMKISHCIGCYGCWLRTPGVCVQKDDFQNIAELFCRAEEIILLTQCAFGGYSPFVKNVMDRCLGHVLPFFEKRKDGKLRHVSRTTHHPHLSVYFYGEVTEEETRTAKKLVEYNAMNLHATAYNVAFYRDINEIRGE